jgi:hypothetical protein
MKEHCSIESYSIESSKIQQCRTTVFYLYKRGKSPRAAKTAEIFFIYHSQEREREREGDRERERERERERARVRERERERERKRERERERERERKGRDKEKKAETEEELDTCKAWLAQLVFNNWSTFKSLR